MLGGGVSNRGTRLALIDVGPLDGLLCRLLHCLGKDGELLPVLEVGGRDVEHPQVTQRVCCDVHVAAHSPFAPGKASTFPARQGRLSRGALENHGAGVANTSLHPAQHVALIVGQRCGYPRVLPTPVLLRDPLPLR